MEPLKQTRGRTPFEDLTNLSSTDGANVSSATGSTPSIAQPPVIDPAERKRQRERERYAKKQDEILKKRREERRVQAAGAAVAFSDAQVGSQQSILTGEGIPTVVQKSCALSCIQDGAVYDETANWLHRNDAYERQTVSNLYQCTPDVGICTVTLNSSDQLQDNEVGDDGIIDLTLPPNCTNAGTLGFSQMQVPKFEIDVK